jgi:hypothetical protein
LQLYACQAAESTVAEGFAVESKGIFEKEEGRGGEGRYAGTESFAACHSKAILMMCRHWSFGDFGGFGTNSGGILEYRLQSQNSGEGVYYCRNLVCIVLALTRSQQFFLGADYRGGNRIQLSADVMIV